MINLKPYPQYKDSGVPWIGKIPVDWNIVRNKNFLNEINMPSIKGTEELLTVSQYTGITKRRDRLKEETDLLTTAKTLEGYKIVEKEAMVMNIMLAWNGSLGVSEFNGIVSPAYSVFKINKNLVIPKYLHYLHRTKLYTGVFETESTGVIKSRLRLYPEKYFALKSVIPQLSEQIHVARYLDWKTSQINKFIKAKKKLIELLKEQKQVIINDAVTGKIDVRTGKPYPKYKDSGVEWLGVVPVEWEVRRLKFIAKLKSGGGITSERISDKGDYPVFGGNGMRGFTSYFTHEGSYALIGRQGALCGNINYASGKFWASEHAVVVNPISNTDVVWLGETLRVMNLNQYSIAAAQPGLSVERILNIAMPYPALKDQHAISNYITKKTSHINMAISFIMGEISLLQEYRNRLIADAATGRVDLRDIRVPEFKEEDVIPDLEETSETEKILGGTTDDYEL